MATYFDSETRETHRYPNDTGFARAYQVPVPTARNWRLRELPLKDPEALLAILLKQRNPGTVINRLSKPEVLAATKAAVAEIWTPND